MARTVTLVAADSACDDIIAQLPFQDENVLRALNLKGIIAEDRRDYLGAKTYYQRALALDPKFSVVHGSLGNLYTDQDKPDAAIEEPSDVDRLPALQILHASGNKIGTKATP
jgi:hypothetical protein